MRIDELNIPRIPKPVSKAAGTYYKSGYRGDFEDALKKMGWKPLSSGAYSTVFSNPRMSHILKINDNRDRGFENYVDIIKHNPNKHFPKISDMKKFKYKGKIHYIYFIERLYELNDEFMSGLIYDYVNNDLNDVSVEYLDYLNDDFELKMALDTLIALKKKNNRFDVHSDNVMRRRNGTVVITDPYAKD